MTSVDSNLLTEIYNSARLSVRFILLICHACMSSRRLIETVNNFGANIISLTSACSCPLKAFQAVNFIRFKPKWPHWRKLSPWIIFPSRALNLSFVVTHFYLPTESKRQWRHLIWRLGEVLRVTNIVDWLHELGTNNKRHFTIKTLISINLNFKQ